MAVFLLLLLAVRGCSTCNARRMPTNREKVVEEYVVSAKFDEKIKLPQLNGVRHWKMETQRLPEGKDGSLLLPFSSRGNRNDRGQMIDDSEDRGTLEERDLLVHHHHIPPLPHPPPPPAPPHLPPPGGLSYGPSIFAVGLITFLILLNSLQTSLLLTLKSKGSILGSVTGALGRRRRSVQKTFEELENYKKELKELGRRRS